MVCNPDRSLITGIIKDSSFFFVIPKSKEFLLDRIRNYEKYKKHTCEGEYSETKLFEDTDITANKMHILIEVNTWKVEIRYQEKRNATNTMTSNS